MSITIGSILARGAAGLAGTSSAYATGRYLSGNTIFGLPPGPAAAIAQFGFAILAPVKLQRHLVGGVLNSATEGVIHAEAAIRGVADRRKMSVAAVLGLAPSTPATIGLPVNSEMSSGSTIQTSQAQ